ncbi:RNA polymerase sigma factor [Mucilaginibacter terrae]|uniref:RNA polymerase sigma factor n=1 Tax=Mucilaginibacter terrae TaxID=1955052 RepID=UPI0036277F0D
MNRTDRELIGLISTGSQDAFQVLFNRHWKPLYAFVFRLTRDEDHSKDILQDVFMYIWNNREKLYTNESFLPYLHTIAKSSVMSNFRKNKVRLEGVDTLLNDIQTPANSDDKLLLNEVQVAVDTELSKMPTNMRQCFKLSRYEDKSIKEIAAELKLSEQTVKNNISVALQRLRQSVEQGSLLYLSVLVIKRLM